MFATTVHTTGINIEGLLANTVAILVIVGAFTGIIVRLVKRSIGDEVNKAIEPIIKRLDEHDTRLARLEGVEEGKRYAVAAAGVSSNLPHSPQQTDSESTTTTTSRTKRKRR